MTKYRLVSETHADFDIEATFDWYESERAGLGIEFLHDLHAAYDRIVEDR